MKNYKTMLWLLFSFTSLFSFGQTKNTAKVQIQNSTGATIYNVVVVHKYSDNYKDRKIWSTVGAGQNSSADFNVRYNTGFGTTGKDWWLVSWTSERDANSVTQYTTAPNNFRDIIDVAEKAAKTGIPIATSALSVVSVGAGPQTSLSIAGGSIIANELASRTMNTESTDGFKQHILRSEDAGKVTTIQIKSNGTVIFKSPSGNSETVYKSQVFKFDIQGASQPVSTNPNPNASAPAANRYYEIQAKHSGKFLDVSGISYDDGAKFHQWTRTGGDNQKFLLKQDGNGFYVIVAKHSGKVLDVSGISQSNSAVFHQWSETGGDNQKFRLQDAGNGYYYIIAKHSGKALDVSGISLDDGAVFHQWDLTGGDNQKFMFIPTN